jgi:serine/threonine protein phosphatase PrpC
MQPVSSSLPDFSDNQGVNPKKQSLKRGFTVGHGEDFDDFPVRTTVNEKRMLRKRVKAAVDHAFDPEKLPVGPLKRPKQRISLVPVASSNQGKRPANEDEHVIVHTKYGDIFAICDGHGVVCPIKLQKKKPQLGQEFARIVARSIEFDLPRMIEQNSLDTKRAFEIWAERVHRMLPKEMAGTTAAIGFVEKINHLFHVANIGDSKIIVFRMIKNLIYPIPMTPEINWSTPECVNKVRQILSPGEFEEWHTRQTKDRRFPPQKGVNLSNSLGDHLMTLRNQTAITHHPECSLLQLQDGDLIVLGCDGLFDFVELDDLIQNILKKYWNNQNVNLAQLIANHALQNKNSTDNVTVITVRVISGTEQVQVQSSQSTQPLTPLTPS